MVCPLHVTQTWINNVVKNKLDIQVPFSVVRAVTMPIIQDAKQRGMDLFSDYTVYVHSSPDIKQHFIFV